MSTETAAFQTQAPILSAEPQAKSTDIAPLMAQEKEKLLQFERTIEANYQGFLECARALLAIRNEKLYRYKGYATWEDYIVERWALSRSRADELCRAATVAETLLSSSGAPNGETPLPESIPEVVLRPLSRLSSELQGPVWKLASLVSPERGPPTQATTAKLVRLVEEAICEGYAKKNGQTSAKPKPEPQRERVFFGAITRLSKIEYIPEIICLNVAEKARAEKFAAACQEVSEYCQAVRRELDRRFSLNLFTQVSHQTPVFKDSSHVSRFFGYFAALSLVMLPAVVAFARKKNSRWFLLSVGLLLLIGGALNWWGLLPTSERFGPHSDFLWLLKPPYNISIML